MRTLTLPIHELQSPQEILSFLAKENLRKGDRLDLVVRKEQKEHDLAFLGLLLLLGLVLLTYFGEQEQTKNRVEDGENILKKLFEEGQAEKMEKNLESKYGIEIGVVRTIEEADDDDDAWRDAAPILMNNAYDDDEPDYSDVPLLEPNPNYRPWKKEQ